MFDVQKIAPEITMMKLAPLLLTSALIPIGLSGCSETMEVRYATFSEAVATGAVSKGQLPPWLPNSTSHIHQVIDADTMETQVSCQISSSDRAILESIFKPAQLDGTTFVRVGRADLWPPFLTGPVDVRALQSKGFLSYSAEGWYIAANWSTGLMFLWSQLNV